MVWLKMCIDTGQNGATLCTPAVTLDQSCSKLGAFDLSAA